jgi:predicted nucleic acid-binding protein
MGATKTPVLVDTGIFVAAFTTRGAWHADGTHWVERLGSGEFGKVFTTDYLVAEALNSFVGKARDPGLPERVARNLLGEGGSPWVKVLHVDEVTWRQAREVFRGFSRPGLSFTDCIALTVVRQFDLEAFVRFDCGFDGFIRREG